MEALSIPVEDVEWIGVEERSAPGHVRRSAMNLAHDLGFTEHRAGEIGIAASELATNLVRHAVQGVVLIRIRRETLVAAVELVAIDAGPGVADFNAITHDGHSGAGSLGIGLGAAMRAATWFDAHSVPGRGTVIVATFWPGNAPMARPRIAALTRAMQGEVVCGDAWAQFTDAKATTLMLADGLGHGELAAAAARQAVRTFAQNNAGPADTLRNLDGALRGTRGAAVAVVRFDASTKKLTFAGVGNVGAWVDDGKRRGFAGTPGIVGAKVPKIREVEAVLADPALVVLHSDGLSSRWDLDRYPGLRTRDPHLIAATLMRDAGVRHDDASVVVAAYP